MRALMAESVTVVVNNRDLLTWPRAMIGHIERFDALAGILVVDNGSTYPPLLEFYRQTPHEVVFLGNLGHTAPWSPEVLARIATDYYVVTDPDLDLEDTPRDCLLHLMRCLQRFPRAGKIGLGLRFDDVPRESPYFHHVHSLERRYWELPLVDGLIRPAPVDTTFAIYHKALLNRYAIGGARTDYPYTARHPPWSVVTPDAEFQYYLDRANESCSYKTFVKSIGHVATRPSPAGDIRRGWPP
jgi:hypothetical protein